MWLVNVGNTTNLQAQYVGSSCRYCASSEINYLHSKSSPTLNYALITEILKLLLITLVSGHSKLKIESLVTL